MDPEPATPVVQRQPVGLKPRSSNRDTSMGGGETNRQTDNLTTAETRLPALDAAKGVVLNRSVWS